MKKSLIVIKPFLVLTLFFISVTQICFSEEPHDTEAQGKIIFIDNCSLCHGDSAKGDGVFSKMLTIDTPDLTLLTSNNGGVFPFKEVFLTVDGRDEILIHGPRYMPLWGDRFKTSTWANVSEKHADTLVRGTIFELLIYLESIQE